MNIESILSTIYPINDNLNIILANGRFPKDKFLQSFLVKANKLIVCDGAANKLLNHGITPSHIVGDCDSINSKNLTKFSQIITKIDDQNINDLSKAVGIAQKLEISDIIILGATGLREDHTIANIALLIEFSKIIKKIAIISDYGIFTVSNSNHTLATVQYQQISFFSPIYSTKITCNNLKWPLYNYSLGLWNNGTLNEATGKAINLHSTNPILVYRSFCIKNKSKPM